MALVYQVVYSSTRAIYVPKRTPTGTRESKTGGPFTDFPNPVWFRGAARGGVCGVAAAHAAKAAGPAAGAAGFLREVLGSAWVGGCVSAIQSNLEGYAVRNV